MQDLFDSQKSIRIPQLTEIEGKIHKSRFVKYGAAEFIETVRISTFSQRSVNGFEAEFDQIGQALFLDKKTSAKLPHQNIFLAPSIENEDQLVEHAERGDIAHFKPKPKKPDDFSSTEMQAICDRARKSWDGAFQFRDEIRDEDGKIIQTGLRSPQLGALYATLAHWSVSDRPATIVMPTGTGKTETMLALLTATGIERLMVVVPNVALRDQIAKTFQTLGILKVAGVLGETAETPIVATLEGRPTSVEQVREIFSRANVIVTNMQIAGQCEADVQEEMAKHCSHLFIDEAHHIAAKTWQKFRGKFANKLVVQFTATPFRTDGKRVDGKFIYTYPLAKAQEEGYFKPVNFCPVQGLEKQQADKEIIRLVGQQLEHDLDAGHDHLVLARAETITRAKELHQLYLRALGDHNPVLIHSQMSRGDRATALDKIYKRESRIIVCVDMFGEGFNLPQLKISGLHDRHKSVAITLQFTGRFTRDATGIGDTTVIANIEQSDVDDALRSLYAEDADWNFLLNVLSETKTARQVKRAELMEGFGDSLEGIPLQTLIPKMSTVVYKTECDEWRPHEIENAFPVAAIQAGPIINDEERIAIFVTREETPVRWSTTKVVTDIQWHLYLVHWDVESKLLYINSSKSKDLHEKLAKALGGESASRIVGEPVYRALHGLNRLMLMNLGLSSLLGRHVRYTMFVGSDITSQISDAQFTAKRKSNLFGIGYDGAGKRTIGCSAKGKFWSMQSAADFSEWLEWCHELGAKIIDETIPTDEFIRNLVKQEQIFERPADKSVLTIHWPETFLIDLEERISLRFGTSEWIGFFECEIEPISHEPDAPLHFRVKSEQFTAIFEVSLSEQGASYLQIDGPEVFIKKGAEKSLAEVFGEDPPHIYFSDGDFLIFNELFTIPRDDERKAFNPERIETRNWDGVDLSKESQGVEKSPDSIQYSFIQLLLENDPPFDVIFDDDGTGEIADIVALREQDDCLQVDLFHLKYAHGAAPGNRVADLYEVCGQAQKSIRWMEYPVRILKRIRKREKERLSSHRVSRFERGNLENIRDYIARWKLMDRQYRVWIVQPGLHTAGIEPKQLDLLAATENFLIDTYGATLHVVGSE